MKVNIRDVDALRAVTPAALAAYARDAGWRIQERYRKHSNVYVGEGLPEIIIPRTERLGDYASIVAAMIDTFAKVADLDETTVYRLLVASDRDERAPRPDVRLPGFVRLLQRDQADIDGTIGLAADVDGRQQTVVATLDREDYSRAVQAHHDKAFVVLTGDLDRMGQRWRLLNPRLENVISDREAE